MKPTREEILAAVRRLSYAGIERFPHDPFGLDVVTREIWEMVSDASQLNWLETTLRRKMRRYSLAEIRGIFCTRFRPADGIEGYAVETPGYTPADQEAAYYERVAEETNAKMLAWSRESKLLPAPEPLNLPVLRDIAEPAAAVKPVERKPLSPPGENVLVLEAELKQAMDQAPRRTDEENNRLLAELQAKLFEKSGGLIQ